jgi:hypothetical protein
VLHINLDLADLRLDNCFGYFDHFDHFYIVFEDFVRFDNFFGFFDYGDCYRILKNYYNW